MISCSGCKISVSAIINAGTAMETAKITYFQLTPPTNITTQNNITTMILVDRSGCSRIR